MADEDSEAHQHFLDAQSKYESGDYQGALDALERVLEAPDMREDLRPQIWLYRAYAWMHLGEWALADDAAAQAGPEHQQEYQAKRAELLGGGGGGGGGGGADDRTDTDSYRWYLFGKAQYDSGDYQGAMTSFDSAIEAPDAPEDVKPGIEFMRALCLLQLGVPDQADAVAAGLSSDYKAEYEAKKAELGYGINQSHRWYLHGKEQYDAGSYQEAYQSFDEALASPDVTEDNKPGLYFIQALCLLHLGAVDQADALADLAGPDNRADYEARKAELAPAP